MLPVKQVFPDGGAACRRRLAAGGLGEKTINVARENKLSMECPERAGLFVFQLDPTQIINFEKRTE